MGRSVRAMWPIAANPKPDGHHTQVGLHTLAMGSAGCLEDLVYRRLFIGDRAHPSHVQVGQPPSVLKGGMGLSAATGQWRREIGPLGC